MSKEDNLKFYVGFRTDSQTLEGLEGLTAKFKVGQSEVIRMGIKRLMESYLNVESDVLVIDREKFDEIKGMFFERIELLNCQQSTTAQIMSNLLNHPAIKEALKLVDIKDIEIDKKQ